MNLLEHYIEEIHDEELVKHQEWMSTEYVKVDITTNCYGHTQRKTDIFPKEYWEKVKEKGYYMA